jgi:hypothetical protein
MIHLFVTFAQRRISYNILCCTQLQFRTRAIDGRLVRILNRIILNFDFLGM